MIPPDLIVTDARIYTNDPAQPWAEALAVTDGIITAVGSAGDIDALAGEDTRVHRADGGFMMPGLGDVHIHLGLGGTMIAWELALAPGDSKADILEKVRNHAAGLGPDEWIVGGAVNGVVMAETAYDAGALAELDDAAGGRPVVLRDDSMHNRWVSSATLAAMGLTPDSVAPEGNEYVRDTDGALTGWLFELVASSEAEAAHLTAIVDPASRHRGSIAAALAALSSVGVTAVQDAGSMPYLFDALRSLDETGDLSARVVTTTPMLPFVEPGTTGDELHQLAQRYRGARIRPDFAKFFIDGVPMTRTSFMLEPYICHDHTEDPEYRGEPYWALDDLVAALRSLAERGLGAKMHAIGDASVRHALDAVELLRAEIDTEVIIQIAHVGIVAAEDIPRFAQLRVAADLSPQLWFPTPFDGAIAHQVPASALARAHRHRSLHDAGTLLAAGSDWPAAAPSPSPWLGLQTLVTRENPDPSIDGVLSPTEALTLEEAIAAFTTGPAAAMGLADVTGRIRVGMSADFIALDRDLFASPVTDIHRTRVLSTWFEGRVVHELH